MERLLKYITGLSVASLVGCLLLPVLLLGLFSVEANAQSENIMLRGFVRDADNAKPLIGANVILKSLKNEEVYGAVTGTNGQYVIHELPHDTYAVQMSFVGYQSLNDTLRLDTKEGSQYTFTGELNPIEQQMGEVVVTGESEGATLEAGLQTIAPENLSLTTPSIQGDLANYLQTLPSVVSAGDRGGEFFIRGGSADQNLVLMDKIQVYRPFHIVGFYSAFTQDLISDAQVYAGGFPEKYSDRLSSVIDVSMRAGNKNNFEGAATLDPFLSGLRVEGPINDNLSFLASGRFSQIEHTSPFFLKNEQPLKFGDQFFKLQSTSDNSWCSLTGLHTYDRGKIDTQRDDVFQWSNYGFGGRCVAFASGSSSLIDMSLNASVADNSVGTGDDPEREANILNVKTRIDMSGSLKGGHTVKGGFKGNVISTRYSLEEQFTSFRSGEDFVTRFTGYTGMTIKLTPDLEVSPGFSLSAALNYDFNFEPRLRATWRPFGSEKQSLNAALGLYHQTLVGVSDERDLGSTFTAWTLSSPIEENPRALHAILGWNQRIGNVDITVEGYHKRMENLAVPSWINFARFTTEMTSSDGTVWGFDLRGEFRKGDLHGYIGYGFSWTQYQSQQENRSTDFQTYHPPHDQRHSLNALFSTNLGFANLDIRWKLGSGMPYTRPFGFDSIFPIEDLQDPREEYGEPRLLFEEPYRGRLPLYHRLDVSMDRNFEFEVANLTAKAGVINGYDRQNLFYYDLFRFQRVDQLPIIPFVAVEIETN